MALLDSCFLHLRSAFDKFHKKFKKKKNPVAVPQLEFQNFQQSG